MSASAPKTIRCPACGGPSIYAPSNEFRPFCSARCRNHDLGAWASESYAVPARPDPEDDDPSADAAEPRPRRPPPTSQ